MLEKIQKRLTAEVDAIIKKETLAPEDYNILVNEYLRLNAQKENEKQKIRTDKITSLIERIITTNATREYDN